MTLEVREVRLHDGPWAGQVLDRDQLRDSEVRQGSFVVRDRGHEGRYVRDEGSDGGRHWDWQEAS